MIKDANNVEMIYWPINGLVEGQSTDPIVLRIDTPVAGELRCEPNPNLRIMARVNGSGAYQDIASDPIDLSGFPAGQTEFQIYAEALSPIAGALRVVMYVSTSLNGPAAWTA